MALLTKTNGPGDELAGIVPSDPADRDGSKHWLVFSATEIFAVHADGPDVARALVLDRLGYTPGSEPSEWRTWLADGLDARPAAATDLAAICRAATRRRVKPLHVRTPSHGRRISKIAGHLHHDDLRHAGSTHDVSTGSAPPAKQKAAFVQTHKAGARQPRNPFGRQR